MANFKLIGHVTRLLFYSDTKRHNVRSTNFLFWGSSLLDLKYFFQSSFLVPFRNTFTFVFLSGPYGIFNIFFLSLLLFPLFFVWSGVQAWVVLHVNKYGLGFAGKSLWYLLTGFIISSLILQFISLLIFIWYNHIWKVEETMKKISQQNQYYNKRFPNK